MDFVVFPKCYHKFRAEAFDEREGHVYEGSLSCVHCQMEFEISKGIPRLMVLQQNGNRQVRSSFGYKWAKEPDIGTEGTTKEFAKRFYFERYNWYNGEEAFGEFVSHKKQILDVGCGPGRILRSLLPQVQGNVFAFDINDSVEYVFQFTKNYQNIHIFQADLFNLPFREPSFDYVIANAVFHHTPSTEKSFKYICSLLAKDGVLETYIYRKKRPNQRIL